MDNPATHEIFGSKFDRLQSNAPRAILTPFGLCVVGPLRSKRLEELQCNHLASGYTPDLDVLFERFYDDDSFGVRPQTSQPVSVEDKRALEILKSTTCFVGNRYESGLLWWYDAPTLPNNRLVAERRFLALEGRFQIDPKLAKKYSETMSIWRLVTQEDYS